MAGAGAITQTYGCDSNYNTRLPCRIVAFCEMKILVTGAAGFIGMHVSQMPAGARRRGGRPRQPQRLLRPAAQARPAGAAARRMPGFRFVRLDVADRAGDARAVRARALRPGRAPGGAGRRALFARTTRTPTSTATSSASSTCWKAAGTAACSTWSMRRARASTAATRACRSPSTTTSTIR